MRGRVFFRGSRGFRDALNNWDVREAGRLFAPRVVKLAVGRVVSPSTTLLHSSRLKQSNLFAPPFPCHYEYR